MKKRNTKLDITIKILFASGTVLLALGLWFFWYQSGIDFEGATEELIFRWVFANRAGYILSITSLVLLLAAVLIKMFSDRGK